MLKKVLLGAGLLALLIFGGLSVAFFSKYMTSQTMRIKVEELSTAAYPEDPAPRSIHYDRYLHRELRLVRKDENHFDFIFESEDPAVATIQFANVDASLFIPVKPAWIDGDRDLEVLTFVEREWNRQQVRFSGVAIEGGDGFERANLTSAELSSNCLNAGLWEVLLYTTEEGAKKLYYHGWFNFPLGLYKKLFKAHNKSSYWSDWFRLEHWFDPAGTPMDLSKLRRVRGESVVRTRENPKEAILVEGEQLGKLRTLNASNIRDWEGFVTKRKQVHFATFLPPGRYSVREPWGNEFQRIAKLEKTTLRRTSAPNGDHLDEIELLFTHAKGGHPCRFFVSGFNLSSIPQLPTSDYPQGFVMPMGISVPPVSQSYEDLLRNPPQRSPYFSVMLDEDDCWINHHALGVDGVVMHRDSSDSNLLHLYILSYERHTLLCHFEIPLQ